MSWNCEDLGEGYEVVWVGIGEDPGEGWVGISEDLGLVLARIWGWFWGSLGWFWGGGEKWVKILCCKKMKFFCKLYSLILFSRY